MYNGIGVPTARGTGTNGYVVKSLAHLKTSKAIQSKYNGAPYDPSKTSNSYQRLEGAHAQRTRKTSTLVYEHFSKRDIEKKLFLYEETLRKTLHCDDEIDRLVSQERERLLSDFVENQSELVKDKEHLLDKKKAQEEKFRAAFDIDQNLPEGRAFRFEERTTDKQPSKSRYRLTD